MNLKFFLIGLCIIHLLFSTFVKSSYTQTPMNDNRFDLARIKESKTGRVSSWNVSGYNKDRYSLEAGETRVLADIKGPGVITHIWMTQQIHYRECLLRITWDDAEQPSVLVPLGDFFCLGHGIVNSFESLLFSASVQPRRENKFNEGAGLNCYIPMPFKKRAVIELINESKEFHEKQYFYIDYETFDEPLDKDLGYFHAEFRRCNPYNGLNQDISQKDVRHIRNIEKDAWNNNYVILDTKGKGHYIGCNISVTNLQTEWWGEGDDMIWVDGYKWPPDLHGTGSEDYLNQAWSMQPNAFLRNGSSIWEGHTSPISRYNRGLPKEEMKGAYQTSYVFHIENPVRFTKEIKVTLESGHANSRANDISSVAYWYAQKPTKIIDPPPVEKRMPVLKDEQGNWIIDENNQCPCDMVNKNKIIEQLKMKLKEKK